MHIPARLFHSSYPHEREMEIKKKDEEKEM